MPMPASSREGASARPRVRLTAPLDSQAGLDLFQEYLQAIPNDLSLSLLNENSTGESFQTGRLVIRDPDSGRKKVIARFTDAGVAEIF